jgi:hypothetical protein
LPRGNHAPIDNCGCAFTAQQTGELGNTLFRCHQWGSLQWCRRLHKLLGAPDDLLEHASPGRSPRHPKGVQVFENVAVRCLLGILGVAFTTRVPGAFPRARRFAPDTLDPVAQRGNRHRSWGRFDAVNQRLASGLGCAAQLGRLAKANLTSLEGREDDRVPVDGQLPRKPARVHAKLLRRSSQPLRLRKLSELVETRHFFRV